MKQNGWMKVVVLAALFAGALFLAIVFGPGPKQVSEVTTLAPFYQKDGFLVAIVRSDQEQRPQDIDLARRLISAEYTPVDDFDRSVPFDAVISMEKNGIAVTPGSFFCRDGRYAEADMPIFQAKNPDEAFKFVEAIAGAQQRICAPTESSKIFI